MLNTRSQRLCAWSGAVTIILFFSSLVTAKWLPVPSPSLTQAQVAAMYLENATAIRIGMVQFMICTMFMCPLIGVISLQLRRIEKVNPLWTYTQISAGTILALMVIIPAVLFLANAYRPDKPPELTYMMNDVCWMFAIMPWPPGFMQCFAIGMAILDDKSAKPIFPRWLAYLNFWVALSFLPGTFIPFVKSGPFAWNGLLSFWLGATTFGIWFIVMVWALLRAINEQAREAVAMG